MNYSSQKLLKSVLEMNHMQMQDLIDFSDPDEGGENPAPLSLMKVSVISLTNCSLLFQIS